MSIPYFLASFSTQAVLFISLGTDLILYFFILTSLISYSQTIDLKLAEEYFSEGEYDKSIAYYQDLFKIEKMQAKIYPNYLEAYILRGILKNELKKPFFCSDLKKGCDLGDCKTYQLMIDHNLCK